MPPPLNGHTRPPWRGYTQWTQGVIWFGGRNEPEQFVLLLLCKGFNHGLSCILQPLSLHCLAVAEFSFGGQPDNANTRNKNKSVQCRKIQHNKRETHLAQNEHEKKVQKNDCSGVQSGPLARNLLPSRHLLYLSFRVPSMQSFGSCCCVIFYSFCSIVFFFLCWNCLAGQ